MRVLKLLPLAVLALLTGTDHAAAAEAEAAADYAVMPVGQLNRAVRPLTYRLDFTIEPEKTHFSGRTEIDITLDHPTDLIWLHGDGLEVSVAYVKIGGDRFDARYEQVDDTGVARLDFDQALPAGDAVLRIEYSAPFASAPAGLFRAERDGVWYVASQLEPISGRKIFPGFDEPSFKIPFALSITAKSSDTVVTTTPLVSTKDLGNGLSRRVFETTPPLPTYLLAFVVGPYDINEWAPVPPNAVRKRPLPLRGIAVRGQGPRMDFALQRTEPLLRAMEEYFDVPHVYPKLDLIAAPGYSAAMENVGAIIYNEYLMLMDEDSAFSQRRSYQSVHAHELAHQWFGNYVTPVWWDDIWLNEAFATWFAYKMAAQTWPEGQFDRSGQRRGLRAMASDSLVNARQIREPVVHNATIIDAFDSITYSKGGAVLGMFESYLGKDAFRDGVRMHMQRFANATATADDFMQSIADGSKRPEVVPAFRSFIDQPGVPLVEASLNCDADPTLEIRQSRYAPLGSKIDTKQTWRIPACVATGSPAGTTRSCGLIDGSRMLMKLGVESCPTWVLPNGDGSGYFRFALSESGWESLAGAADGFEAAQALAYADSLDAAFRANAASAAALLDGLTALSGHDAWDVVSEAMDRYEALSDLAHDEELRALLQALGQKIFRPVYAELADKQDPQSALLRRDLTRFLAVVVLDPTVRAGMLPDARRYVGIDGDPDLSALDPDLAETALSVGVQEDGAPFFDALLKLVQSSGDPALRSYGIGALGRTADPALTKRLLDAVADDSFSRGEFTRALYRQLARPESEEAAWRWTVANYDRLMERSPGVTGGRAAVGFGQYFCSNERAAEYKALVEENAGRLAGYERTLAQSLESIDLCIALSDAKGEQLREAAAARL